MRKGFTRSLVGGLIPIGVFTTIAMTQLGKYSYTKLGGAIVMIQAGYVVLLLLVMVLFFILKKKDAALGFLVSFVVGFFVSIVTLGMGL